MYRYTSRSTYSSRGYYLLYSMTLVEFLVYREVTIYLHKRLGQSKTLESSYYLLYILTCSNLDTTLTRPSYHCAVAACTIRHTSLQHRQNSATIQTISPFVAAVCAALQKTGRVHTQIQPS